MHDVLRPPSKPMSVRLVESIIVFFLMLGAIHIGQRVALNSVADACEDAGRVHIDGTHYTCQPTGRIVPIQKLT